MSESDDSLAWLGVAARAALAGETAATGAALRCIAPARGACGDVDSIAMAMAILVALVDSGAASAMPAEYARTASLVHEMAGAPPARAQH